MELRTALAAQRLRGAARDAARCRERLPQRALPEGARGVFFGVRVLLGPRLEPSSDDERAWRYVDLATPDEPALADESRS